MYPLEASPNLTLMEFLFGQACRGWRVLTACCGVEVEARVSGSGAIGVSGVDLLALCGCGSDPRPCRSSAIVSKGIRGRPRTGPRCLRDGHHGFAGAPRHRVAAHDEPRMSGRLCGLRFALAAVVPRHLASANLMPEPRRIRPSLNGLPRLRPRRIERDRGACRYATNRAGPSLRTVRIVSPNLNYGENVSPPARTHSRRRLLACLPACYLISVSSLNIGRYMLMITMPTMTPTPSIMIGSTIEVSAWTEASTSSS